MVLTYSPLFAIDGQEQVVSAVARMWKGRVWQIPAALRRVLSRCKRATKRMGKVVMSTFYGLQVQLSALPALGMFFLNLVLVPCMGNKAK